ncbi:MAG: TerC family protein [Pirellulales bacterium]|nr:TerC family protein [Pirellulales bacterium]
MVEFAIWHWLAFGALVVFLLALDLVVFHRHAHAPSFLESAGWSAFWIGLALVFNGFVCWWRGTEAGVQFLSGYLIEKSLSMDNIFVFAVIFRFFAVPLMYQYRVLFWGILGAIVLRLAFVLTGTALIHRFDWVMAVFGALLVYTAVKLVRPGEEEVDPERNPLLRTARRFLPVASGDGGKHFFVRQSGRWCITPLFLVLLVVESTDVVFAVDSVPAVFGVTRDPFLVFTSNIFAILGLRALYFLLANVIEAFRYLHYGLSAVLAFVGLKMVAEYWLAPAGEHLVSPAVSLAVVAFLLTTSVVASLVAQLHERPSIPVASAVGIEAIKTEEEVPVR